MFCNFVHFFFFLQLHRLWRAAHVVVSVFRQRACHPGRFGRAPVHHLRPRAGAGPDLSRVHHLLAAEAQRHPSAGEEAQQGVRGKQGVRRIRARDSPAAA